MSVDIRWKVPASITSDANPYTINIYFSTPTTGGEDGTYSLLANVSAGGGNTLSTYTDSGGTTDNYYYVKYVDSSNVEGDRILAVLAPGIREQRLAEQIQDKLPDIVKARIDSNLIDIRKAMVNAIAALNAYSPETSYSMSTMPPRFETGVVVLSLALLYMEHQLQVSIRDYSYGGTGISLQVDRGSKFSASIQNLTTAVNGLLKYLKQPDWNSITGVGLGSEPMNQPFGSIFRNLWNQGSW